MYMNVKMNIKYNIDNITRDYAKNKKIVRRYWK